MGELESIFIRARNAEGNWGSYSLQELVDMSRGDEIQKWFQDKLNRLCDMEDCTSMKGAIITEENVLTMIEVLKKLGVTIVKLREARISFLFTPIGFIFLVIVLTIMVLRVSG